MPTAHESPEILIKVVVAAQRMSVSKAKVYQMLATGELPVVRVGRAVRVPVAALHALVAEQVGEGRVDAA